MSGTSEAEVLKSLSGSDGVFEGEFDFEDLGVEELDLFAKFHQVGVLLLPAGGIVVLSVVRQLVNLEAVVLVLGDLSLFLESLDLAGAHLETIRGAPGRCCP